MKLIGNLKKQVENAETKTEKKSLIEKAGMLLTDDELEHVAGGGDPNYMFYEDTGANHTFGHDDEPPVPNDNGSPAFDMSDEGGAMKFSFQRKFGEAGNACHPHGGLFGA